MLAERRGRTAVQHPAQPGRLRRAGRGILLQQRQQGGDNIQGKALQLQPQGRAETFVLTWHPLPQHTNADKRRRGKRDPETAFRTLKNEN